MKFDYRRGWNIDANARPNSFDYKGPYIDNGTGKVDPRRYYDPAYARLESERLWSKTWLLAGPVTDVAEPGDFFRFDIGLESFIVVRGNDGIVRAHFNVCPHRGAQIAMADFGSVQKFSCPFHGWTFGLDGALDKVRDAETFRNEVLCGKLNLNSVRCEVVGGLIFISMNEAAPGAREWLGVVAEHLDMYGIQDMKVIQHKRSEWNANWKTGIDAFAELYHLSTVHPQTQGMMEDYHAQLDLFPNGHSRHILRFALPSVRFPDQESVNPGIRSMLTDAGIDPDTFNGTAQDARSAIQIAKRERAKKLGLDYSKFTDSQLSDSIGCHIFPNNHLGLHPEGAYIMRFIPHESDPNRFFYDTIILFKHVDDPSYRMPAWAGLPDDIDVNPANRPEIVNVPIGTSAQLGEVLDQDAALLPFVQRGVRSRSFRGPVWSEQELRLRHYHKELDRYLDISADEHLPNQGDEPHPALREIPLERGASKSN